MADEKKYKYTVKRFAKMLTVHPDKRVTFQDDVNIRNFIVLNADELVGKSRYGSLTDLVADVVGSRDRVREVEINDYWPNLVEHGELLAGCDETYEPPNTKIVGVGGQFIIGVQFHLNPEKVAAWLAATGFPQMSRAKEEDNGNAYVAD